MKYPSPRAQRHSKIFKVTHWKMLVKWYSHSHFSSPPPNLGFASPSGWKKVSPKFPMAVVLSLWTWPVHSSDFSDERLLEHRDLPDHALNQEPSAQVVEEPSIQVPSSSRRSSP